MKLVTAQLMRSIDRDTIENGIIPGPKLMENAGRGIAERIRKIILAENPERQFTIFCGKGNNGGDGFVVGRYLHQYGSKVVIYYPSPSDNLSEDARLNFNRASDLGIEIHAIDSIEQLPEKLETDYIIDGVFGTGFTGSPRGLLSDFIEYMNSQSVEIIAIDCPSGLNVDSGKHEGVVIHAAYTFTLALPKIGLYFSPGRELSGYVEIVPIGVPDEVIESFEIKENLITYEIVYSLLPARKPDGYKGDFGRLFILAGSIGLTGAAVLSAKASARSGVGLVTVGCPASINQILEIKLTEAMTYPLPDVARKGVLATRGLGEIRKKISGSDATIIGPGLGRHHETVDLIQRLINSLNRPAIIDADGLNAFEKDKSVLEGEHVKVVLTPHLGEFKRIIDEDLPEDILTRSILAVKYANKYNAVIVLKGSPTMVVDGDGRMFLSPTGNEGMATGGSGDVLTGIIGSFLAQGMTPLSSAICGVFIHGLAGDIASAELGSRSVIAGDLIEYLPDAFRMINSFCQ
ncbi:MAG: NAD(P)H-hydrate dehydratase [Candidatus Zixiibacteriota bacterium]